MWTLLAFIGHTQIGELHRDAPLREGRLLLACRTLNCMEVQISRGNKNFCGWHCKVRGLCNDGCAAAVQPLPCCFGHCSCCKIVTSEALFLLAVCGTRSTQRHADWGQPAWFVVQHKRNEFSAGRRSPAWVQLRRQDGIQRLQRPAETRTRRR